MLEQKETHDSSTVNDIINEAKTVIHREKTKKSNFSNNEYQIVRTLITCDKCTYEVTYHFRILKNESFSYSNCVGPCPLCGSKNMSLNSESVVQQQDNK